MKQIVISTLSAIILSSMATPAFANEVVSLDRISSRNFNEITPFSLITAGFQGRLKAQGIPAGAVFLSKIRSNRIGAKDLVQSVIASGRLSEATFEDAQYLAKVDSLLSALDRI
ncbi:MAG: hypothetical protein AAF298_23370 [Cyanobacteria bacterium P01_A01_bin.40]